MFPKMSQECHSNIDATSLKYRVEKCLRDLTFFIVRMLKTQNIVTTLIPNGGVRQPCRLDSEPTDGQAVRDPR